MPDEGFDLFESVIHITGKRDKRSLEKALVEVLSNFIDFDALILLRVPRNPDNEYLEVAVSVPDIAFKDKLKLIPHEYGDQRIKRDDSIGLCIEKNDVIEEKQSTVLRTLFPVEVNDVVTGVLDIYGYQNSADTEKLIRGFIRIYSNFQVIIHDTLTGLRIIGWVNPTRKCTI